MFQKSNHKETKSCVNIICQFMYQNCSWQCSSLDVKGFFMFTCWRSFLVTKFRTREEDWQRHQNKFNYRSSFPETLPMWRLNRKNSQKKSLQVDYGFDFFPSSISCIDVRLRNNKTALRFSSMWNFPVCDSLPFRKLKYSDMNFNWDFKKWSSYEFWWILNEFRQKGNFYLKKTDFYSQIKEKTLN